MPRPNGTWAEIDELNHFEHDATLYAREIRDIGYDDSPEALAKLDGFAGLISEHRVRVLRRAEREADRIASEEMETAIPPYEVGR